jgi:VWFA-related protein
MKPRVLLFVVLASAASSAAQKEERPSFPAGTEIVTVDAVVLDRQGAPIRGLTREDFSVREDGVAQEIAAFEAVDRPVEPTPPAATAAALRRATSSNVDAESRTARGFVLVFDELHLAPNEAKNAREAVRQFLETGVSEGDHVTLIGTAGTTWWTARIPEGRDALLQVAARLQGRRVQDLARDELTDYEAMRIDRDRDPVVTDRVAHRLVARGAIYTVNPARSQIDKGDDDLESRRDQARARAAEVYARSSGQNAATLTTVERALASLTTVRGRKSLVLVSGGLVYDMHLAGFRRVVAESRRANVAIYFLDARGLTAATSGLQADAGPPLDFNDLGSTLTEAHERSDGAVSLAADTGGFSVENQNDLGSGISRIARESASYYLLGYSPSNKRADGRFRKIEVKVRGSGRTVRARRGYYAPGAEAASGKPPEGRDAAIQRAIDSPFDLPDVPLRAAVHVLGADEAGKARVVVTVEADIRPLAFSDNHGASQDTLETMLVVADRGTGEFFRFDQQFSMNFRPETRARYERTWFSVSREVPLVAGSFQARIVARDKNSGRVGSLTHDFEIPTITGFRISTPVLSDRLREAEAGGARDPEVTARRVLAPSGLLHCRFEVYGAAKDPGTGAPRVTAGFSIRRSDGKFLAAAPETPLKPASDGTLARTMGVPLDGAPVGAYEMIVVATDLVAGQVAEIREPFDIAVDRAP